MWVFSPQGIAVYFTIIFHYLGSSFIKPWYCIINGYSPSNLKTIRPGCQGFLCSSIITRTQFDHMTSSKVVFLVQWGKVTWPMTVEYQMQMSKLKKSTDKLCLLWKSYVKGFSATSEQSAFPHIEGNIRTYKLSLMPYITVGLVLGRRF